MRKSHMEERVNGHSTGKTLCGREGGFRWDAETCEACVRVANAREKRERDRKLAQDLVFKGVK